MTRGEALDLLTALSPSEFDEILERLDVPTQYLPGVMAPQVERAIAAARYLESHERLDDLQRLHVRPPARRLPAEAAVTLLRDAGVIGRTQLRPLADTVPACILVRDDARPGALAIPGRRTARGIDPAR